MEAREEFPRLNERVPSAAEQLGTVNPAGTGFGSEQAYGGETDEGAQSIC
jgi:hypothetical protein